MTPRFPQVVAQHVGSKEESDGFHQGIVAQGKPWNEKAEEWVEELSVLLHRVCCRGHDSQPHRPIWRWRSGRKDGQIPLQRRYHSPLLGLQQTALFRERLLAHERCKLLKGQQGVLQSLDGNLLEQVLLMPDDKDLLRRIDAQIDVLPDHIHVNVVAPIGNAHRAILTYLPNEMLFMDLLQPRIGVNEGGKRGQTGKCRKGYSRWPVATRKRLIGSLRIVMDQEACRHLTDLFQRVWPMHLQTLLIERAMVPLHVAIFIRTARRADVGLDPQTQQEAHERGGKIASGGSANETRVAIKSDAGRQAIAVQKTDDRL